MPPPRGVIYQPAMVIRYYITAVTFFLALERFSHPHLILRVFGFGLFSSCVTSASSVGAPVCSCAALFYFFFSRRAAGVGLADDLNDLSFAFGKAPFLREVPGVLNLNALHVLSGEELVRDAQGRPRELGLRKLASM